MIFGHKERARIVAAPKAWTISIGDFFAPIMALGSCLVLLSTFGFTDASLGVCTAILGIFIGLANVRIRCGKIHPLSLYSIVALCQVLLFILRPLYSIVFQDSINIFTGQAFDVWFLYGQIISAFGFLSFSIGYAWVPAKQAQFPEALKIRPFPRRDNFRYSFTLMVVATLGFALYGIYVSKVGFGAWWEIISVGRSEESARLIEGTTAYLYSGIQFASGALVLLALHARLTNNRPLFMTSFAFLVVAVIPNLASGSRSVFIPVFVAVLLIISLTNPSLFLWRKAVIWMPIAFVGLIIAPRIWRDSAESASGLASSLSAAFTFEAIFEDFLGGLDTAMLDAFSRQVEAQASGALDMTWGSTYLTLLSSVVPRIVWPSKPATIDGYLNAELFPHTYSQGIGFSFGFYSEPYLAFGPLGVVVICFGIGLLSSQIANRANTRPALVNVFVLIMVISYIFPLMRGSISFDLQRLLMPLIPALIGIWIVRLLRPPS